MTTTHVLMAIGSGAFLMQGGLTWDKGKRGEALVWVFYGLLWMASSAGWTR